MNNRADLTARALAFAALFAALAFAGSNLHVLDVPDKLQFKEPPAQTTLRIHVNAVPAPAPARTPAPVPQEEAHPEQEETPATKPEQAPQPAEQPQIQEEPAVPQEQKSLLPAPQPEHTATARTAAPKPEPRKEALAEPKKPAVKTAARPVKTRTPAPERTARAVPAQRTSQTQKKTAAATARTQTRQAATETATQAPQITQAELQQQQEQVSRSLFSYLQQHAVYPKQALRRRQQGQVTIEFRLQRGVVIAASIRTGSGKSLLDEAALKLAQSLRGFDTGHKELTCSLLVPVQYQLR